MKIRFTYKNDGYLSPVFEFDQDEWKQIEKIQRTPENLFGWCYYDEEQKTITPCSPLGNEYTNLAFITSFLEALAEAKVLTSEAADFAKKAFQQQINQLRFIGQNENLYKENSDRKDETVETVQEEIQFLKQQKKSENTVIREGAKHWRHELKKSLSMFFPQTASPTPTTPPTDDEDLVESPLPH
jgi:hypothetical protein